MRFRYSLAGIALLFALQEVAHAGVVIMGTRVVFDATQGRRDVTVQVRNDGEQPAMVQVWLDDGDAAAAPSSISLPLRLTPADPRLLQAQQSQIYRLNYAPGPGDPHLPKDRESLLYLNLLDIPPAPKVEADANYLQFAVRSRIKLFYRPEGLAGSAQDAIQQVKARMVREGDRQYVLLENPTAFHVNLVKVTLGTQDIVADVLEPRGQGRIELKPSGNEGPLKLQWLDDHGASRLHTVELRS